MDTAKQRELHNLVMSYLGIRKFVLIPMRTIKEAFDAPKTWFAGAFSELTSQPPAKSKFESWLSKNNLVADYEPADDRFRIYPKPTRREADKGE